ncbi:MAG: hypothetical protein HZB56_13920 [Deltaproteobacteria bacterium]|nr:hypothetical protein [Deltaproteobacteria bacterium]
MAAALADLSRQLLSEVRAETTVARTADGASERQRVDDLASVRSDSLEVPGAEVVATCYDPDAATLHALVAVERAGLRRALLAERDGVRAEAARLQASIAGGAQSLEGVRRARRAVRLLERAERRSRVARALGGEPPATDPTLVELRRALNAMALRIGVAVEASASEPLRSELRAAVSRSGLPLCEPGSTEAALVALRLSLDRRSEAVAQMAGVTVVRARATVDLVRLDTGVVLSSLTHQETGSASTPGRAEALAAVALARWFAPRVEEALRRTDAEEALP